MGAIAEILGAVLAPVHGLAQGIDEAHDMGGGLGPMKVLTSGMADGLGTLRDGLNGDAKAATATADESRGGNEFFASLLKGHSIGWSTGGSAPAVPEQTELAAAVEQKMAATPYDHNINDGFSHGITFNGNGGAATVMGV